MQEFKTQSPMGELEQRLMNIEAGLREIMSMVNQETMTTAQSEYILVEEAAKILGVHRQTLYRYISTGKLKAVKRTKRNYIRMEDLNAFMNGADCIEPARLISRWKGGGK